MDVLLLVIYIMASNEINILLKLKGVKDMRFRLTLLAALFLAFLLVLAACSGDGSADPEAVEDDTTETEESPTEEEAEEEETAASGEKVLVFARGGDSESLDPGSTTDGESSRVTQQVLEGLIAFDKESFDLKPALAHDWEVS